jgi:hypothetical protein
MRYDRDGYDRLGFYDRAGYTDPFSLGLNGTGAFTVRVDRTIPLEIAATGEYSDELVNRAIPLGIEATGVFDSLLVDYAKVLAFGATGAESLLLDRSLQLAFEGSGVFDYTDFRQILALSFGAEGAFTVDPFLRGLYAAWGATGAYPIECDDPTFSSIMAFDRGRYDCGTLSTNCQIYPVRVDRTIPLNIAATGIFSNPIFDWYLQCAWGATGAETDPSVNRTIPLSIAATGVFADITPFIPVHYLTANWGSTGTFVFGYTWIFDIGWGATGHIVQSPPFIPIHYLSTAWGATGAVIDPRIWRAIVNINNLLISGKISRSLADKMYSAVFQFDKTTTDESLYWSKVVFKMPDYTGSTFNTVFVGTIPSGDVNYINVRQYATALGKQSFKAYDYAWYLSNQTVEPQYQVLLKSTDQNVAFSRRYRLAYTDIAYPFIPGDRVVGASSGHSATVIETHSDYNYIVVSSAIGSYPYFQDLENLTVCGTVYAKANGSTSNYDNPAYYFQCYPSSFIKELLGGGSTWSTYGDLPGYNWDKVTGIYPKYFKDDSSVWGVVGEIPEIEFAFTPTTTKIQAIEQICNYMKWIFYVRWDTVDSVPDVPCAYFLPQDDLDLVVGQPLPAPVYVTSTGSDAGKYLKSPFRVVKSGENHYNWIEVRCQGLAGEWHMDFAYQEDPYDPIYNPTGVNLKRPYCENNPNITTYLECQARVNDLKAYYFQRVQTWTATFKLRSDFALLQKLIISGYGTALPDGDYRIISIEYNYDKAGTVNEVTVNIISDSSFSAYLNLKRVFYDPIFEIQNIAQKIYDDNTVNMKGIVVDGNTLPSQVIKVALTGVYGSVVRTAYSTTALAVGDSVTLTQDQTSGRLMAVKA